MKKLISTFLIGYLSVLFVVGPAWAANYCTTPTGAGDYSGSSWSNAAKWNSGANQIAFARGDGTNIYYVAGGSYEGRSLSTNVDSTKVITIRKASAGGAGCNSSTAGWNSSYETDVASIYSSSGDIIPITTGYWTIDGVTGGGPGSWKTGHGISVSTEACSGGSGLIRGDTVNNITLRHLSFYEVNNAYTPENCPTASDNGPGHSAFFSNDTVSNSYFGYLYVDNIGALGWFLRAGTTNILEKNYTGNIAGCSVWVNPETGLHDCHTETIVFWTMSDMDIRYNLFNECPSSGCVVRNGSPNTTAQNVRIYGNVFQNGAGVVANYGHNVDWRIINNTFTNCNAPISSGGVQDWSYIARNNILYISTDLVYPPGTYSSEYAISGTYCSSGADSTNKGIVVGGCSGCDCPTGALCAGTTCNRNPFVSVDPDNANAFKLAAAEDAGLTTICTSVSDDTVNCTSTPAATYNYDWTGAQRTNWSRGALEYGGVPPATSSATSSGGKSSGGRR